MLTKPYLNIIITVAIALSVILTGCAKPGTHLEPPRISLVNIEVQNIKLFETILQIELRVINPNDVLLQIQGIICDLELHGNKFASGVSDERVKIQPFRSAVVPMAIYSSVFDVFRSLATSQKVQDLHYKIAGKVHVTGGQMQPSVIPFISEGRLSFEEWNKPE
ncbi:MAG TPA: hypothetical protein ENO00_10585 [Deltaproteobacteria bacterium]|nr:hypothetical protein [Deltaproteobacteria bacterium]